MTAETFKEYSYSIRHDFFQAGMISALLFGLYTTLVLFTLHKILSHSGLKSLYRLLPMLMVVMYTITIVHFALFWVEIKIGFVDHGDSSNSTLAALQRISPAGYVLRTVCRGLLLLLGDCIMIWRCWRLYNQSWRVAAIPLALVTAELAIWSSRIVFQLQDLASKDHVAEDQATTSTSLLIAHFSLTLATTVITTGLIVYRIVRMGGLKRYQNIAVTVVESSAIYASALIIYMPFPFHPVLWTTIPHVFIVFSPGIASTLLIARVSLGRGIEHSFRDKDADTNIPTARPVSILHFRSAGTVATRDEERHSGGDTAQGGV